MLIVIKLILVLPLVIPWIRRSLWRLSSVTIVKTWSWNKSNWGWEEGNSRCKGSWREEEINRRYILSFYKPHIHLNNYCYFLQRKIEPSLSCRTQKNKSPLAYYRDTLLLLNPVIENSDTIWCLWYSNILQMHQWTCNKFN